MCAQYEACVVYVRMFSLVPVLVQFSLENSQVTSPDGQSKSQSFSVLTGLSEGRRRSVSENLSTARVQGWLMICRGRP